LNRVVSLRADSILEGNDNQPIHAIQFIKTNLLLTLLALLVLPAFAAEPDVTSINRDQSIQVLTETGMTKVTPWLNGTVRIEAAPGKSLPKKNSLAVIAAPDATGWKASDEGDSLQLTGSHMTVKLDKQSGLVSIIGSDGKSLLQEVKQSFCPAKDAARDGLEITTMFKRNNEQFFGGGVIGPFMDKPTEFFNWNEGDWRDAKTEISMVNINGHIRIPVLYSSRGYSLFWDNPSRGKITLTKDSLVWDSSAGDLADFYVMAGPSADQAIGEYRKLTGGAPLFPKWAYGFWFSKCTFFKQDEILKAAARFRTEQFPIDLIIQDWFYWHPPGDPAKNINWGSHQFTPDCYPDPKGMIDTLHHNDHMRFMSVIWGKFDPTCGDHYKELEAANGLFPAEDWAGKNIRYYDPYDAKARQIYGRQVMDSLLPLGQDAFWMDGAEPELKDNLKSLAKFEGFNTTTGPVSRVMSAFPLMHVDSVYTAQRAATEQKRVVLLPRSAWAGSQRYAAANWTGDIPQEWKTLAWQIEGLQNYSIAGLPYITTDVGGYYVPKNSSDSDKELFVRWFEWGTFCPIFRVHGRSRPFPWEYGKEAEAILKKFDRLRYRLMPYIYSQAGLVTFSGGTIMRPLVMDFQNDTKALQTWDEFLFGPSLLVCPIYEKGITQKEVYLPGQGQWYDFWTGEQLKGGQTQNARSPLDSIPLFIRGGSILPMGPDLQYSDEKAPDPIELRIYPGADGSFTLYEDEGDSYRYENGAYATIPISWNNKSQTLTIGKRQGSFPGKLAKRTFQIVWVGFQHGVGVEPSPVDTTVDYNGEEISLSKPQAK
jgi:alpha-D-xyloside xylohydrolase